MASTRKRRNGSMSRLPAEAREAVMRVWLEILREKHPGVSWVPVERDLSGTGSAETSDSVSTATDATAVAELVAA
jgi:hypothetical protein